jgi:hypothetical protein
MDLTAKKANALSAKYSPAWVKKLMATAKAGKAENRIHAVYDRLYAKGQIESVYRRDEYELF